MLNMVLYITGWILSTLIIVAITLVVLFGHKTNLCRRDPRLYCYSDWTCDLSDGSTTTSGQQLLTYRKACYTYPSGTSDADIMSGKATPLTDPTTGFVITNSATCTAVTFTNTATSS